MSRIELMAPAGSYEILEKAIDAGADAIYLGLGAFNARINADNFTLLQLQDGCHYAHRRSSKVYLTLNTLVNDYEIDDAITTAVSAYEAGVDGFIVQDIGLANKLKSLYPDFNIIASTQMNVFSSDQFKSLKENGYSRVVLPRELSLSEIRERTKVAKRYGLETEVFAHGAVCVCASGLCLFSSMNKSGSRSGNRGLCAQPCRQQYSLVSNEGILKTGHLLSPKDRSIIPYLSDIIASGVSSLKIEGRMRDVDYVVCATKAYRKLIDAYYDGLLSNELCDEVMNDLLVSFNRGGSFTSQYLDSKKSPNFLSGEYVGKYGLRLGIVSSTDSKKGTITFTYDESLPMPSKGDYLSIRNKTNEICSFPIGKIHSMPKSLSVKGLHPEQIDKISGRPDVFLMSHSEFAIVNREDLRKTHIDLSVDSRDPNVLRVNARVNSGMIKETFQESTYPMDDSFTGSPLSFDRAAEQLKKMGDTPFIVDNVFFVSDSPIMCKVSEINELRRQLADELISEIDFVTDHTAAIPEAVFESQVVDSDEVSKNAVNRMYYYPSVRSIDRSLEQEDADIYAFSIYDLLDKGASKRIQEFLDSNEYSFAIVLPDFSHDNCSDAFFDILRTFKEKYDERFDAIIDSRSLASIDDSIYNELGVKHFLSGGSNIYNSKTLKLLSTRANGGYLSYELSFDDMYNVLKSCRSSIIGKFTVLLHVDGQIPWMQSDYCPTGRHQSNCTLCLQKQTYHLEFENDRVCTIALHRVDCSSTLYGRAKNTLDDEQVSKISELGIDLILVHSMI